MFIEGAIEMAVLFETTLVRYNGSTSRNAVHPVSGPHSSFKLLIPFATGRFGRTCRNSAWLRAPPLDRTPSSVPSRLLAQGERRKRGASLIIVRVAGLGCRA
jgi:hypothetical protein